MRVLVTGGAGLIGSHTVDQLLARNYDVRVYDSLEKPTHSRGRPPWIPDAVEFIHADVRDHEKLAQALEGADYVVHLAATGGFTPRIADYIEVNSLATARLLEHIRDASLPIRKIVVASSIAVYGEGAYELPDGRPYFPGLRPIAQLESRQWEVRTDDGTIAKPVLTGEATPVDPATAYAISKYDQERMALAFGRETGIPTVALRYFVTYGPRQSLHNPYTGVCTIFASRIANQLPLVIYEDGLQTRDFVYVEDVARANVHVLESEQANGRVFNVGTGNPTRLSDLAEVLQRCLGTKATVDRSDRFRPSDVRHMVADPAALASIGYTANTTLEEGLDRYVGWLSRQGPLPEYFGQAESELKAAGIVRSSR